MPALLLWSPAPGHQLQPALLPPLWRFHRLHPATHSRGHTARAHPQLLLAEHHSGLHSVGRGWELPALLWHPCGFPGTGQGRTAVPGHWAVECPWRAPPPACASDVVRKGKRSTQPRLGKRIKETPLGFPAVASGGQEPCELVTPDHASVHLYLTNSSYFYVLFNICCWLGNKCF